jgi:predicted nucleic acid-binding protein
MAIQAKIFLDTDVVLDHLAQREPFAENAHRIFALAETGALHVHVSSLTFNNLYYLLRKMRGHPEAVRLLRALAGLFQISPVTRIEIENALLAEFSDLEDAIQYASACSLDALDAIVTRNTKHFSRSKIRVLTPEEFLAERILPPA